MKRNKFWATVSKALAAVTVTFIVILAFASATAAQPQYKVLHTFSNDRANPDGTSPYGGLILDAAGNLYGTTAFGYGDGCYWHGCGTAFILTQKPDGSWRETAILLDFFWTDPGSWPMAGLTFDANGNLYGTTAGDYQCCGRVFAGTPNSDGTWTWTELHSFTGGNDGARSYAGVIVDASGNLYGTTTGGGSQGYGVVFKLTRNPDGSWTESVLHSFTGGKDGANPYAGLIFDNAGNLYGTTVGGGKYGYGVVFRLTPNPHGSWTEKVLHKFTGGKEGANPYAGLIFDAAGSLYGTTVNGGPYGYGVAYKLTPNAAGCWVPKILHKFTGGKDGANPYASLVLDTAGNFYGTTWAGGAHGLGVVFKLSIGLDGRWGEHVLHAFAGQPARNPYAGVILDAAGNLYGTTAGGSSDCSYWTHCGAVYEITP
ncbi:MAG: choice-of-anchor tandem repeat GloVer-containing protein [Terriglobales bacterium]